MKGILVIGLTLLVLTTFVVIEESSDSHSLAFEEFKVLYQRKYNTPQEEAYRRHIFMKNLEEIESHNAKNDVTYTKGINMFTDLSLE